jgi:hypothetical protein
LPAFGASFVRGIATNSVDQDVTPEALVQMTHSHATGAATHGVAMQVIWAFFRDPTNFIVSLDTTGQPGLLKLQMSLKGATWQVTRIWLPPALLAKTNART